MKQGWEKVISLLPKQISKELSGVRQEDIQELRLRVGMGIEINYGKNQTFISVPINKEDILSILNTASRYSPWQAETMSRGYLTANGGHRIGICGEVVLRGGIIQSIRNADSICIRIAKDVVNIGNEFAKCFRSILFVGPPGAGKTTLLRDAARAIGEKETVLVVDEREEIFPEGFHRGKRMDILRLCPKSQGIDMGLRSMGPDWICVDEITEEEDCVAILKAGNCGVKLLATAHAENLRDLQRRPVYRMLFESNIFENIVAIRKDNSFVWERKETWN